MHKHLNDKPLYYKHLIKHFIQTGSLCGLAYLTYAVYNLFICTTIWLFYLLL